MEFKLVDKSLSKPIKPANSYHCRLRGGGDIASRGERPHRKRRRWEHASRATQEPRHSASVSAPETTGKRPLEQAEARAASGPSDEAKSPSSNLRLATPKRRVENMPQRAREPKRMSFRSDRIRLPVRDWPIGREHSTSAPSAIKRCTPTRSEAGARRLVHARSPKDKRSQKLQVPSTGPKASAAESKQQLTVASGEKTENPILVTPVAAHPATSSSSSSSSPSSEPSTGQRSYLVEDCRPLDTFTLPNWGSG